MKIGRFSKETGISIDTLRYYDKIGLLVPKRDGITRLYQESDFEILNLIEKLKHCDFSLEEIKAVFVLESFIESDVNVEDIISLKKMFAQKQALMEEKLNHILSAGEIIDGAINKLDLVLKDEALIKSIMEGKNEY